MRVTIFGSGYVGLVTGACLADAGNHVLCVDVDAAKDRAARSAGDVPIHEPGLDDADQAQRAKRTACSSRPTPRRASRTACSSSSRSARRRTKTARPICSYVLAVARDDRRAHDAITSVVVDQVDGAGGHRRQGARRDRARRSTTRGVDVEFDVVSNPEFLKEGAAIETS